MAQPAGVAMPAAATSKLTAGQLFFRPITERARKLPLLLDHFNRKDLQTLVKCVLAVWVYTLLIFITPTLRAIGQAVFFGAIIMFILPPSGVLVLFLLADATVVLGCCLGWLWGTISMKAALATRPAADVARRYGELSTLASGNTTNPTQASGQAAFAQIAIFEGFMLDTRVSVTYFCMVGLFIYLMSRLSVKAPKLKLVTMFAIIISDIYITIGPLIPAFQGTIPQTLIKPTGVAAGVGAFFSIALFPVTSSQVIMEGMLDLLEPLDGFLEACAILYAKPSSNIKLDRLKAARSKGVADYKATEGAFGFLPLDISKCRWAPEDLQALREPFRQVMVAFLALINIHSRYEENKLKRTKLGEIAALLDAKDEDTSKAGHHSISTIYDMTQQMEHPDGERLIEKSLLSLATQTDSLLAVCREATLSVRNTIEQCNKRRWTGTTRTQQDEERHTRQQEVLIELRQHREELANKIASNLWNDHLHLFDSEGRLVPSQAPGHPLPPIQGIVASLILEDKILTLSLGIENLLRQVSELDHKRRKSRIWLPTKISKLLGWAISDNDEADVDSLTQSTSSSDSSVKSTSASKKKPEKERRKQKKSKDEKKDDPEEPRTVARQMQEMRPIGSRHRTKLGLILVNVVHWFSSTEAMYALRVLVVTIAIGVLAVIPRTAGFFYREKGLWALIMAQTSMQPYTADFIFGFILKMAATVVGAIIGLVAWYIGAGHGTGNPYGLAAVMVPIIIVLMWLRLFANPMFMQGIIIAAATVYLVVAYSYIDTHIPSYGNPGVGYEVFWRRMLLVLLGFLIAALVTLFPRPPSANRHQRRVLSETISTAKNQYAIFVNNCRTPLPDLKEVTEKTALATSEILMALEPQIKLSKFEFSTSNINEKTLSYVCAICTELNEAMTELTLLAPTLDDKLKQQFITVTGCLEERLFADIMAVLTLVQQALKSGDPLPEILPVLSVNRQSALLQRIKIKVNGEEQGGQLDRRYMSQQLLAEEGARKYFAAMVAFGRVLRCCDEAVIVVKRAVGETSSLDREIELMW